MKKFLVLAIFAALIFVVSCGSDSKSVDTADTGETAADEDTVDSVATGDSDSENPDTIPDEGNSEPDADTTEPVSDPGDSQPDGADTTPDNDSGLADSGDDTDSDTGEPEPTEAEKCVAAGGIWNGSECLNPCDPNPCSEIANSTGVCTVMNATSHSCGCEQNYFWNGSKCINPCPSGYFWSGSECVNPCEDTPCSGIAHSTGICSATAATVYSCSCEENYSWNGSACFHPCDNDPCSEIAKSTGICTIIDSANYTCGCEQNYFWSGSECVNPCDDNPCNTKAHAVNDSCSNATDWNKYTCECGNGYFWNDTDCVDTTQEFECTELPDHAQWNEYATVIRTWNGEKWIPESTAGIYNETSSRTECRFKCDPHYTWRDTVCEADTQFENCSPKPENTTWNDNGKNGMFQQEWTGSGWNPESYESEYSTEAGICKYKCENSYFYHDSECVNPCGSDPCGAINHALSDTCSNATDWDKYSCSCEENYSWTGSACFHPCDNDPCHDILHSTGTCTIISTTTYTCGCEENYFWTGSECVNPCDPNPCADNVYYSHCVASSWEDYTCELPECGPSGITPCKDSETGFIWSEKYSQMDWSSAVSHCESLNAENYGGYSSGWHLSNISELRSIIMNCGETTGADGSCGVRDDYGDTGVCLEENCRESEGSDCVCTAEQTSSKLGETNMLWSSSTRSDAPDYAWVILFFNGSLYNLDKSANPYDFRCVHSMESKCYKVGGTWNNDEISCTKTVPCVEKPEHSEWNGASSYVQTYSYPNFAWGAETATEYGLDEGVCHFKCKSHYTWHNTVCEADQQFGTCSEKPENSEWNDNGKNGMFLQEWTGSWWNPRSYESEYSTEAGICKYKCKSGYFYHDSECINPCDSDPCGAINHALSGTCSNATDWDKYSCNCEQDCFWSGHGCGCFFH